MYKNRYKSFVSNSPRVDDKGAPIGVRKFQQLSDTEFELNEFGYIRNDISILVRRQNTLSFERSLEAFRSSASEVDSPYKGMSDDEIIASIRPRWCQLPAQVRQFEEWLIDKKIAELQKDVDVIKKKEEEAKAEAQAKVQAAEAQAKVESLNE